MIPGKRPELTRPMGTFHIILEFCNCDDIHQRKRLTSYFSVKLNKYYI